MPHIHKEIDFVAVCFVVCDGEVLLAHHKKFDAWVPVGGHIELHEDPIQAIHRELREETGLVVELIGRTAKHIETSQCKPLIAPTFMDIHGMMPPDNSGHRHIALIYIGLSDTKNVKLSDEHHELRWLNGEDLDRLKPSTPSIRYYASSAISIGKQRAQEKRQMRLSNMTKEALCREVASYGYTVLDAIDWSVGNSGHARTVLSSLQHFLMEHDLVSDATLQDVKKIRDIIANVLDADDTPTLQEIENWDTNQRRWATQWAYSIEMQNVGYANTHVPDHPAFLKH